MTMYNFLNKFIADKAITEFKKKIQNKLNKPTISECEKLVHLFKYVRSSC